MVFRAKPTILGTLDAWAIYSYNGQLAIARQGARLLKTGVGYLSGNFGHPPEGRRHLPQARRARRARRGWKILGYELQRRDRRGRSKTCAQLSSEDVAHMG
ncbi:hypothetical protein ACE10Z_23060 [Bradyrhizobium sp. Pha-3]|uniref:hypothetical protein n=1 Tax=Bradyrhizobium sp. Pha-3 TaxID=208375 RepID=UPI0035D4F7AA